jgi:hypothetical protein
MLHSCHSLTIREGQELTRLRSFSLIVIYALLKHTISSAMFQIMDTINVIERLIMADDITVTAGQ